MHCEVGEGGGFLVCYASRILEATAQQQSVAVLGNSQEHNYKHSLVLKRPTSSLPHVISTISTLSFQASIIAGQPDNQLQMAGGN